MIEDIKKTNPYNTKQKAHIHKEMIKEYLTPVKYSINSDWIQLPRICTYVSLYKNITLMQERENYHNIIQRDKYEVTGKQCLRVVTGSILIIYIYN